MTAPLSDRDKVALARDYDRASQTVSVGLNLGVWAGRGDWAGCSVEHRAASGTRALAELDESIAALLGYRARLAAAVQPEPTDLALSRSVPGLAECLVRLVAAREALVCAEEAVTTATDPARQPVRYRALAAAQAEAALLYADMVALIGASPADEVQRALASAAADAGHALVELAAHSGDLASLPPATHQHLIGGGGGRG